MCRTPWECVILQALVLEGNLDIIWIDLSNYSGEKPKPGKNKVTSARLNHCKITKLILMASSSEFQSFLLYTLAHSLSHCLSVRIVVAFVNF